MWQRLRDAAKYLLANKRNSIKAEVFKAWKSDVSLIKEKLRKLLPLERKYKLRKFLTRWTKAKKEVLLAKQNEQKALAFKLLVRKRAVFHRLKKLREAKKKCLRARITIESNLKDRQLIKYFKLWRVLTHEQLEEKAQVDFHLI